MVDPELRDGNGENEQADEVFLERFFLWTPGENEEAEDDGEKREDKHPRQPAAGQPLAPRTVLDRAA